VTRKPARAGVGKRPASGVTNQAVTRGDDGPAAKQRPSSEVQPPSGPEASGARPQPSGSALVRKNALSTAGRPTGGSLPRIPPPGRPAGSRPIPERAPVSARAPVDAASEELPPASAAATHTASAPRAVATPTTIPRVRPPRLAIRSGSTPVEVSSFTFLGLQDVEP
jgi:hypothetical protein